MPGQGSSHSEWRHVTSNHTVWWWVRYARVLWCWLWYNTDWNESAFCGKLWRWPHPEVWSWVVWLADVLKLRSLMTIGRTKPGSRVCQYSNRLMSGDSRWYYLSAGDVRVTREINSQNNALSDATPAQWRARRTPNSSPIMRIQKWIATSTTTARRRICRRLWSKTGRVASRRVDWLTTSRDQAVLFHPDRRACALKLSETSSPWAMTLSCENNDVRKIIYKPSKLG